MIARDQEGSQPETLPSSMHVHHPDANFGLTISRTSWQYIITQTKIIERNT